MRRQAGHALGLLVVALGAVVLLEYVTRRSLGMDLLFGDAVRDWFPAGVPGRPSPHTALVFLAAGAALAFLDADAEHGNRPARVLTPAATLIAGAALFGRVCHVGYLTGSAHVSGMSLTTATVLMALTVGIVLCRPERPPMTILTSGGVGGAVVRRLGCTCAGAIVVIGIILTGAGRSGSLLAGLSTTLAMTILIATVYAVLAWTGSALDVAERDQQALVAALGAERDFTQTVLQSLRDGVIVLAARGTVVQVSQRWCEITGFPSREVVGLAAPFPWWPPEHADRCLVEWTAVLAGQMATEGQIDIRRADGVIVNIMAAFEPVRDGSGEVRMFVGTYRTSPNATRSRPSAGEWPSSSTTSSNSPMTSCASPGRTATSNGSTLPGKGCSATGRPRCSPRHISSSFTPRT